MKQKYIFGSLIALAMLVSCNQGATKKDSALNDSLFVEEAGSEKAVKKIFLNLPSPVELTQTVLKSDAPFNKTLLNPVLNASNYTTSGSLALNFGVYGTDLCYCRIYEQLQESINYLSVIRKLSEKLQIPEEEGAETINRIEESLENRDSIFQIIAETYAHADGYLKENEREQTATLILAGGWIEGMYIATSLAENKNPELITRIAEQKYSIENLVKLLEPYKQTAPVSEFFAYLLDIQKIYSEMPVTSESSVVVTDQESKVTTLGNKSSITITEDQIDELTRLIGKIRGIIIG